MLPASQGYPLASSPFNLPTHDTADCGALEGRGDHGCAVVEEPTPWRDQHQGRMTTAFTLIPGLTSQLYFKTTFL
eukprot:1606739-Rhodomonas_salina.1